MSQSAITRIISVLALQITSLAVSLASTTVATVTEIAGQPSTFTLADDSIVAMPASVTFFDGELLPDPQGFIVTIGLDDGTFLTTPALGETAPDYASGIAIGIGDWIVTDADGNTAYMTNSDYQSVVV